MISEVRTPLSSPPPSLSLMHAELGAVVWPTLFAITVSIALATVLVVCKNANRMARTDSVQYTFIATVKAKTPRVTYLDFPAPSPPNHDDEVVRYEPTILRTFGRTVTKLRFRSVPGHHPSIRSLTPC